MNAAELIADFAGRGVSLEATPGGKLRYSPKSKLDAADIALLKARKDSILNILGYKLSPLSPVSPLPNNPDRNGNFYGDSNGDSSLNPAVTTPVTMDEDLPDFVRRRYKQASALGLIAKWSPEIGYVSIHDPTTGEWHDLPTIEAPGWAKWEAWKRKEHYKGGNREAYRMNAREMSQMWEAEQAEMWNHPAVTDRGIVYEDYLEED